MAETASYVSSEDFFASSVQVETSFQDHDGGMGTLGARRHRYGNGNIRAYSTPIPVSGCRSRRTRRPQKGYSTKHLPLSLPILAVQTTASFRIGFALLNPCRTVPKHRDLPPGSPQTFACRLLRLVRPIVAPTASRSTTWCRSPQPSVRLHPGKTDPSYRRRIS